MQKFLGRLNKVLFWFRRMINCYLHNRINNIFLIFHRIQKQSRKKYCDWYEWTWDAFDNITRQGKIKQKIAASCKSLRCLLWNLAEFSDVARKRMCRRLWLKWLIMMLTKIVWYKNPHSYRTIFRNAREREIMICTLHIVSSPQFSHHVPGAVDWLLSPLIMLLLAYQKKECSHPKMF